MEGIGTAPVFIETTDLAELIKQKKESSKDVRVLNCTLYLTPEEGDCLLAHKASHIPSSEHIDLRYLRDIASPYPFMMPPEKQWVDYMKA